MADPVGGKPKAPKDHVDSVFANVRFDELARAEYDTIYAKTVGWYLSCRKVGGAATPVWDPDEEKGFRKFILCYARRIARRLEKLPGGSPTPEQVREVARAEMTRVHENVCAKESGIDCAEIPECAEPPSPVAPTKSRMDRVCEAWLAQVGGAA
jgi:hypothetical protein